MAGFAKELKELLKAEIVHSRSACSLYEGYFGHSFLESATLHQRALHALAAAFARKDAVLLQDVKMILQELSIGQIRAVVDDQRVKVRTRLDSYYRSYFWSRVFRLPKPSLSDESWQELLLVSDLISEADLATDYPTRYARYTEAHKRLNQLDVQAPPSHLWVAGFTVIVAIASAGVGALVTWLLT